MKKRFLAGILSVLMGVGVATGTAAAAQSVADYGDCVAGAWYEKAIDFCVQAQVMHGTGPNRMEPDREITRAEFFAMVVRLMRAYKEADISQYRDVDMDAWYGHEMALGVQMGIVKGVSDTRLDPKGHMTREQAWTVLARVLSLPDGDPEVLDRFSDRYAVSGWAVGPAAAMVTQGRLKGYPDRGLQPQRDISRAETAQLLMACFPNLGSGDLGGETWNDNLLYLPDGKDVHEMEGTDERGTLVLSVGLGNDIVNMRDVDIGQLVCWGAHDVYVYPGCRFDEIVISRTDGPCIIHWLGDRDGMPPVTVADDADPGSKVVDKDDRPVMPKPDGEPGTRPSRPVYVYRERAYFHYDIDGKETTVTEYLKDGMADPFEAPVWEGHVFAGWYYEPEFRTPYKFGDVLEDKTDLYGKWYEAMEWDEIQKLNQMANGAAFRVDCETDILVTVGEETIPCRIRSVPGNGETVSVTLRLTDGTEVAAVDALEPGQMATQMRVLSPLDYGNYAGELVFRDMSGNELAVVEAGVYVAYLWNRGERA